MIQSGEPNEYSIKVYLSTKLRSSLMKQRISIKLIKGSIYN